MDEAIEAAKQETTIPSWRQKAFKPFIGLLVVGIGSAMYLDNTHRHKMAADWNGQNDLICHSSQFLAHDITPPQILAFRQLIVIGACSVN